MANIVSVVSTVALPNRPILSDITMFFTNLMKEQLIQTTAGNSPRLGRRVYLFLSGHGFAASMLSQAALCMADSQADISSYPHLGGQVYADDLGNRGMFDEVYLWMDCCRQMIPGMSINPPSWAPPNPPVPPRRFFWGFATSTGQLAAEADMLVGGRRLPHGVFTALMMEGFEKCKTRLGGQVCASDVANYVQTRIVDVLGPSAPPPRFQTDPTQDMVLFSRAAGLNPVTFNVQGVAAGQINVTTGQNIPALPGPVVFQNGQANIAIEMGIYKATVMGSAQAKLFEVPNDRFVLL
jgi:hypothetical protein